MEINRSAVPAVATGCKPGTPIFVHKLREMHDMYQYCWLVRQSIKKSGAIRLSQVAPRHTIFLALLMLMIGLLAVACGETTGPTSTGARVQVVTTTGILADLARNVGGDLVAVRAIVPPGIDVHTFQATPEDSITISRARVIVSNGKGLDNFLEGVLQGSGKAEAVRVVASAGLEGAPVAEMEFPGEEEDPAEHESEHPQGDPHHWQDPLQTIHYVEQIRDGLVQADPTNASTYQANAAAYMQRLRDLDQEIARVLSDVPPQHRHLVTFHDAFGYFARRYGWRVSAFVPSDASEVTPGSVAQVMEDIKQEGIPAVFAEPQFRPDVLQQAARDTGVAVGTIYSDALNEQVPTYLEMMRFNASSLAKLLK
jgi:ABC-type Zn uptake system ZnuABC Zn-binding protein ZnuA